MEVATYSSPQLKMVCSINDLRQGLGGRARKKISVCTGQADVENDCKQGTKGVLAGLDCTIRNL